MSRFRNRRQPGDYYIPAVAQIFATENFSRSRRGENRRRVPRFFEAKSFDAGLQPVRQAVFQNLPTAPAVLAARDARAGEVRRAPGAGSVVRRGHKHELGIRWAVYETIRVTADFIFASCPLFPLGAAFRTDVTR